MDIQKVAVVLHGFGSKTINFTPLMGIQKEPVAVHGYVLKMIKFTQRMGTLKVQVALLGIESSRIVFCVCYSQFCSLLYVYRFLGLEIMKHEILAGDIEKNIRYQLKKVKCAIPKKT